MFPRRMVGIESLASSNDKPLYVRDYDSNSESYHVLPLAGLSKCMLFAESSRHLEEAAEKKSWACQWIQTVSVDLLYDQLTASRAT